MMSGTRKGGIFGSPLNTAMRGAASSWFTYLKTVKRHVADLLISRNIQPSDVIIYSDTNGEYNVLGPSTRPRAFLMHPNKGLFQGLFFHF